MLERITQLVNEVIASDATLDVAPLSKENVLQAIDRGSSEGGPTGRHWVLDPIDGTRGCVCTFVFALECWPLDMGYSICESLIRVYDAPHFIKQLSSLHSKQASEAYRPWRTCFRS